MNAAEHVRRFSPIFFGSTVPIGCAGCGEPIFPGDDNIRVTFAWEHKEPGQPLSYTLVHEQCRVAYHKRYRSLGRPGRNRTSRL